MMPTATPTEDGTCAAGAEEEEYYAPSYEAPEGGGGEEEISLLDDEEEYRYEGPTTDFTGVQLIWEKVYKGNKCIKSKKFYYCAPCSDMNDENPSIWVDPATAKFLFEPPYLLGGQKTLGEVNFLTLEMGTVGRYVKDLDPDETNPNSPLQPPAAQKQRVVQSTIHYGLTPIRTYTIP